VQLKQFTVTQPSPNKNAFSEHQNQLHDKSTCLNSAVQIFEILNRIVTSVFDLIQNTHSHNYSKFSNTYRHQFLTYLTE